MIVNIEPFHNEADIKPQGNVGFVTIDQRQVGLAELGSKEVSVNDRAKNGIKVR